MYQYLQAEKGFEGFCPEHPLSAIVESMLERSNPNFRNEPDIKWNFTKLLVNREGRVIARFEPTEDMENSRSSSEGIAVKKSETWYGNGG